MSEQDVQTPQEEGGEQEADAKAASEADPPQKSKKEKPKAGNPVLDGRVEILVDKPFPQYDTGSNKAYGAVYKKDPGSSFIAIVCERDVIPRFADAQKYSKLVNPSMIKLVLQGAVYWPLAGQERYVFVYFHNLGKPLLQTGQKLALGWKSDDVLERLVRPMVGVLADFAEKDFVHGDIRPDNIFGVEQKGEAKNNMVLGECLSASSSYYQPFIFQTIERSMADSIACGVGTPPDDMYAFGVTLAVILRYNDPLEGMSKEDVIQYKLEHGTYAAVTGKDRFKGEILELLRGLLHDESSQRWTVDEVMVWLDGRRLTPKQAVIRKKATRPFEFMGQKYLYMTHLAMALDSNPMEVKRIVEDGSLIQWLKRSVEDEPAMLRTEQAIKNSRDAGRGKGYEEKLACNVSAALDPHAPIRFQRMSMSGDGVGNALAQAYVCEKDLRIFSGFLSSSVMANWLTFCESTSVDVNALFGKYKESKLYIKNTKLGYGLERTLYTLCPNAPCLSKALDDYVVAAPVDFLFVFEQMCEDGKAPSVFFDRHSVAYLMEKDPKSIESYLFDLNSGDKAKIILGELRCLATLRRRYDVKNLPHLTQLFVERLSPVYDLYHDRRIRQKLQKNIEGYSQSGRLDKIAELLDDEELLAKDLKGFKRAVVEYRRLSEEAEDLDIRIKDKDTFGMDKGREWAAIISCILAVVISLGAIGFVM